MEIGKKGFPSSCVLRAKMVVMYVTCRDLVTFWTFDVRLVRYRGESHCIYAALSEESYSGKIHTI